MEETTLARILNFGSLNLDPISRVDAFVQPGETKRYCRPPISSRPRGVSSKSAQRPQSSTRRFFAQAAASVERPVAELWSTSTRISGEPA